MENKVNLFGKEITVQTYSCAQCGEKPIKIEIPGIALYALTKGCNANCGFCIYRNYAGKWNGKKYREILKHLSSKIDVYKIGVGGGEPTLNWDNFVEITEISREILPDNELSLNTNGYNSDKFYKDVYKQYTYVNLSHHHYNDEVNNEIFKAKSITANDIKSYTEIQTHPHQIQLRCNLIKGYIDTKEEIFKYLNWANSINIRDIGLISLMPVNDYCKQNFISSDISSYVDDNFILSKFRCRYGGGCECSNYIFLPEENFRNHIRVYTKNTYQPANVTEVLSYDGEYLRSGFGGEIIY